jgi:hypothetical protein
MKRTLASIVAAASLAMHVSAQPVQQLKRDLGPVVERWERSTDHPRGCAAASFAVEAHLDAYEVETWKTRHRGSQEHPDSLYHHFVNIVTIDDTDYVVDLTKQQFGPYPTPYITQRANADDYIFDHPATHDDVPGAVLRRKHPLW